jgi:hypothetical protein
MTQADNSADLLERAKMHEQLAATTEDSAARAMHQAMAVEYRRRATEGDAIPRPTPPALGPRLEMYSAAQ